MLDLAYPNPTSIPLADATLGAHRGRLRVPGYDRRALAPSVVHIGVGGFHRAHQAVYLDDLAERGVSTGWGILGVSMRTRGTKDALAPQDHLYTVVERGDGAGGARVVGSLRGCLFEPDEPAAVRAALADPRTRVVSLTVTGAPYEERADASGSPFELLSEALDARRRAGVAPFTVLSCDNVPDNGAAARDATVAAAGRRDEVLASWIARNVAFPSCVVDRITPETTEATRELVAQRYGVGDRCPVVAEPFRQWVIEDSFGGERPPLEEVGVRFVTDVRPYELAKKRMLNGGHSVLGYVGQLLGHVTTDGAMADPLIALYMRRLLAHEVQPVVPEVPGLSLREYRATLLARFANAELGDPLARLAGRGSTKMPAYLLPSLADARRSGRPHELLSLAVAAWLLHLRGRGPAGERLDVRDARIGELRPLALAGGGDPRPVMAVRDVFGSLGSDPAVVASVRAALRALSRDGVRTTVRAYAAGEAEEAVAA
jgi:mannitol-1-phosphate/altronate dehydrogenase